MRLLTVTNNDDLAARIATSVAGRATSYNERTGSYAVQIALQDEFDALVVDGALKGVTGLDIIRKIRAKGISTPILLILEGNVAARRTEAFSVGADDVMAKQFDSTELLVRIETLVRRCHGHSKPSVLVGTMLVDFNQRCVFVNGRSASLTPKEFDIVALLTMRLGKVLSKQSFLNYLYGGQDEPEGKIIDVFVCKLRKKLARLGAGDLITTVRGRGYVLRQPSAGATALVASTVCMEQHESV